MFLILKAGGLPITIPRRAVLLPSAERTGPGEAMVTTKSFLQENLSQIFKICCLCKRVNRAMAVGCEGNKIIYFDESNYLMGCARIAARNTI
jgi:hypothetical protein